VRRHIDHGYSLVEAAVAMLVAGVLVALATHATILIARSLSTTTARTEALSQARAAVNSMEHDVRSARVLLNPAAEPTLSPGCQGFGTSAGSCLRVDTLTNGVRRCVEWQLVPSPGGSALLRTRSFSPTWQTDADVQPWRTVAGNLEPASADTAPFTLQGASTVFSNRLLNIRLAVHPARQGGAALTLSSSLSGRNIIYGVISSCIAGPA
jgi:Tfp pilus assembly protein PilX